jgi:uncharacterized protein (DUF1499 family)
MTLTKQVLLMATLFSLFACTGQRPTDIGIQNGALTPCPDSPNCVCSQETRDSHSIAPLQATMDEVRRAIAEMPRNEIVRDDGDYIHAEFTTRLMRFVDDVEFLADPDNGVVHVRSASRLGHSDLGVNRERVEALRALINP